MLSRIESFLLAFLLLLIPSQLALHYWPVWSIINGQRVDYLSISMYFTDLLVILLISINLLIHKNSKSYSGNLSSAVLFLILLFVSNILFSYHPLLSFYKITHYLLYYCLYLYLLNHAQYFNKYFRYIFTISILWAALLAIFQFGYQSSLGSFWYWLGERPLSLDNFQIAKYSLGSLGIFLRSYSTLPHPNALAGFLVISLFIMYLNQGRLMSKIVSATALIALIFTFSRTAIITLLICLVYLGFIKFKNLKSKIIYLVIISTLVVIVISLILNQTTSIPGPLFERWILIKNSINLITTHPFLGIGIGTYPFLSTLKFQPVHNVILLIVSEVGIIGFVTLVILVVKHFKKVPTAYSVIILAILLTSMNDHYWLTSNSNLLLLTVCAAILKLKYQNG